MKLPSDLGTNAVKNAKITVYPNPVNNVLHFSGTDKILDTEIYNMAGQKVLSAGKVSGEGLNVSKLTKGAYILKVKTAAGPQSIKLIKK